MKRKMPGKAVISMVMVLVLVLGATIGVFASDYIAQDATYDGLTVDGSGGWNTADGDNYLVTTHGTTVTFTNTPFQRDNSNWSNFIVETVASEEADGITVRADAYGWAYQLTEDVYINTPSYAVDINWGWDDFYTLCNENTEITLTATKTSDTVVTFDILFGDSGYEEVYTVTYAEGVPSELWFHVGADGGTVTINSVDYVTITDVTVDSVAITEYFVGDYFVVGGSVIKVSYEDGTTETLTYDNSAYVQDADGNYIRLYAEQLEYEYTGYGKGSELDYTGSYGIYFSVSDYMDNWVLTTETKEEVFVVKDVDAACLESLDAKEMAVDTTYTAEIEEYGDSDWFSFTPETSGYYAFESSDNSGYTEDDEYYWMDPYAYLYYVDAYGNVLTYADDDGGDGNNFKLVMYLEAGTTYYLRAYTWGGNYVGVYSVEVSETTVITAVSVSALSQTEFTQYVEYFDLSGTVVTVTYSDGTTADLTIDRSYAYDSYGNTLYYYFTYTYEDEEGSWTSSCGYGGGYAPAGTYVVCIYDSITGACDETQSITVKSLADYEDLTEIELLDEVYEVTDVKSNSSTWFSFTPENTANYYFVVEETEKSGIPEDAADAYGPYTYFDVYYLENENRVYVSPAYDKETYEYLYDESGEYWLYALTEGVTYYIRVYYECGYEIYVEETDSYKWCTTSGDISVTAQELDHTHTYADKVITWTWSDDCTSATAVLRCDTCSHTETATATGTAITSVTTAATATTDGSIVYTATVTINGVECVGKKTVIIPATGETTPAATDPAATDPAAADPAAADPATTDPATTDPAATDPASTATNTSATPSSTGTAPKTSDVSTLGYYMLLLGAAAVIVVLAKKRVNA